MSIALEILNDSLKPKTEYFSEKQYPDAIQAEVLRLQQKLRKYTLQKNELCSEKSKLIETAQSNIPSKSGDRKTVNNRIEQIRHELESLTTFIKQLEHQLQKLEVQKLTVSLTILENQLQELDVQGLADTIKRLENRKLNKSAVPNINLHGILKINNPENNNKSANTNDNTEHTPRITGMAITSITHSAQIANNNHHPAHSNSHSDPDSSTPRMNGKHHVTMQLPIKQDNAHNDDPAEKQPEFINTTLIRFESFSTTVFFSNPTRPPIHRGSKLRSCLKAPAAPPSTARQDTNTVFSTSLAALPTESSSLHTNSNANGGTDSQDNVKHALQSPRQ